MLSGVNASWRHAIFQRINSDELRVKINVFPVEVKSIWLQIFSCAR